jgi:hypothetical protein
MFICRTVTQGNRTDIEKSIPQANPQGKRTARSRSTLPDFLPIDFELIACRFDINHESRPLFRTSTKKKANADD